MAAARNQSSYTEINFLNSQRSLPTQAQSLKIAISSKSPRGVVKQQNIPMGYDPACAHTKQLYQPSKDYSSGHDRSWPGFTSEQGSPTRTGLNRTGEGKSDQEGHKSVDELRDRKGTCSLSVPQYYSTRFWEDNYQRHKRIRFYDDSISNEYEAESISALEPDFFVPKSVLSHPLCFGKAPGNPPTYQHDAKHDIEPNIEPNTDPPLFFFSRRKPTFKVNEHCAIYQLPDDQDPYWEHREWWSNSTRFGYNEAANKGYITGRPYNRIDTLFLPTQMSFQAPWGSTSSAELSGSDLTSHSVSKETVAPKELDLFGRDWISRWKDGPGHNKDWRSSRYLKIMSKGKRAKYQLSSLGRRSSLPYVNSSKATKNYPAITQFSSHIAVPNDMLRQKPTSCQGHSSYLKPESSWQALNEAGLEKTILSPTSRARCEPWMAKSIDLLDIEEARTPEDSFSANSEVSNATIDDLLTAMFSTHTEMPSPKFETPNAKGTSLNHLIAYESFVDTILGACLRLKRLLCTEPHYEVYDAESLFDGNQRYEVRAYNLRGLSLKVRNYKIRNLKRALAKSSCIGSLEQGGKKWLVFADAGADQFPEPFRDCGPLWRTKEEYDRAIPVLESRRPDSPEKTGKVTFQDGAIFEVYDATFETAMEEELSKKLDVNQALEVIDRLRERLVASFKSCHNDDKITPMPEKRKKMKSPEQAKRLRDRQRLSRQTKRMAKTALKLGTNSDSMCQSLDMTSGPPTEAFSGNENNHVATSHTIDNQLQEDFERLRCFCNHTIDNHLQKAFERIYWSYCNHTIDNQLQEDFERLRCFCNHTVNNQLQKALARIYWCYCDQLIDNQWQEDFERYFVLVDS